MGRNPRRSWSAIPWAISTGRRNSAAPETPERFSRWTRLVMRRYLYSFTGGADGAHPVAGVIRDSAGNLYGTTRDGGTANLGVVYEVDATGHETVLHSFGGGNDGSYPVSGLVAGPRGFFYGTTFEGGPEDSGIVYAVTPAGEEYRVYTFTGKADGAYPGGALTSDSAGNLYGTTEFGGTGGSGGFGVVYKIDLIGNESVLYQFTGGADGGYPASNLIQDSAGNLYGTATEGGPGILDWCSC